MDFLKPHLILMGTEFADTPYTFTNTFDGNIITITDNFPLVTVELPVADFSITPTQGTAPLTVKFNDLSKDADSISWDFGDGTNSTERNLEHNYSTVGTYNVKLTAINKNVSTQRMPQLLFKRT